MDTTNLLDKLEHKAEELKQEVQAILNFAVRVPQLRDTVLSNLQQKCNA
jgi:uncharacterized protein Yka (UPF0111/DUF47 family)